MVVAWTKGVALNIWRPRCGNTHFGGEQEDVMLEFVMREWKGLQITPRDST